MKDTIIKADGTSHFIKAPQTMPESYTEWREMVLSGTATLDISLNPEGCTEVGTPLNKSTLLSDETKAELEMDQDNPSVDEALSKLSHKADGDHTHDLESPDIYGVLPAKNGGTGKTSLYAALTAMLNQVKTENITLLSGTSMATTGGGMSGAPRIRQFGPLVFMEGSVSFNVTGKTDQPFAQIPTSYTPENTKTWMATCSGHRLARLLVTNKGEVKVSWIVNLNDGSLYTGSIPWLEISGWWFTTYTPQPDPGP